MCFEAVAADAPSDRTRAGRGAARPSWRFGRVSLLVEAPLRVTPRLFLVSDAFAIDVGASQITRTVEGVRLRAS